MEKEKKLFSKKKNKSSPLLLTSIATRDPNGELKVDISQEGLEEKNTHGSTFIPFDFDLKFSFSLVPPHIRFERNEETATYKLKSSE